MKLAIKELKDNTLYFGNGYGLTSNHDQDCCESHYLDIQALSDNFQEIKGLEIDFSNDDFLERIDGYGIALNPVNGQPIRIAGYGSNNGYYSSDIDLILSDENGNAIKNWDVSECQIIGE